MKAIGIIPARYASTRFPGKPLADLKGKTILQRTWEQTRKSKLLKAVAVATDDDRIADAVRSFGGAVVMTASTHRTGTERCYEAARKMKRELKLAPEDVVINVQGDEPFIEPDQIDSLVRCFKKESTEIATLVKPISKMEELLSRSTAKVLLDTQERAIYFSRAPIPFFRDAPQEQWLEKHRYFKHLGMYCYRLEVLGKLVKLKPSPLEQAESLEQLRWIENGYTIATRKTLHESIAIDTPEDLKRAWNSI